MKKYFFVLMVASLPLFLQAQSKNVVNSQRVFPKISATAAFEKALAAHAKKYHASGTFKWRVYKIVTGPDAGGYHIIEGPGTWDEFDKRGNLGNEHMADWANNISTLLTEKFEDSYGVFREDLSSTALTNYSDKIAITHTYYKPGYSAELESALKSLKSAWEDGKQSIAVYEMSSSGQNGFNVVTRYADGLKERDPQYRASMKSRYEKINGTGSWNTYQDMLKKSVDHSWGEILEFQPALSAN
jgi:hypothetical protein